MEMMTTIPAGNCDGTGRVRWYVFGFSLRESYNPLEAYYKDGHRPNEQRINDFSTTAQPSRLIICLGAECLFPRKKGRRIPACVLITCFTDVHPVPSQT